MSLVDFRVAGMDYTLVLFCVSVAQSICFLFFYCLHFYILFSQEVQTSSRESSVWCEGVMWVGYHVLAERNHNKHHHNALR